MTPTEHANVARVLEAFDTLFNRHDCEAASAFWSPDFVQHAGLLPPGRDGLFDMVNRLPTTLAYDSGTTAASGDLVFVIGLYRNMGREFDRVAMDLLRIVDGQITEQWSVAQDEFTRGMPTSAVPCSAIAVPPGPKDGEA